MYRATLAGLSLHAALSRVYGGAVYSYTPMKFWMNAVYLRVPRSDG
jgi:hypothetical protein